MLINKLNIFNIYFIETELFNIEIKWPKKYVWIMILCPFIVTLFIFLMYGQIKINNKNWASIPLLELLTRRSLHLCFSCADVFPVCAQYCAIGLRLKEGTYKLNLELYNSILNKKKELMIILSYQFNIIFDKLSLVCKRKSKYNYALLKNS